MITSAFAILLAVFAILGLAVVFVLMFKIHFANPEALREAKRLQGNYKNVTAGILATTPDEYGDFRIVRGLKFDTKNKRYASQSALSSEGLKAVFPK